MLWRRRRLDASSRAEPPQHSDPPTRPASHLPLHQSSCLLSRSLSLLQHGATDLVIAAAPDAFSLPRSSLRRDRITPRYPSCMAISIVRLLRRPVHTSRPSHTNPQGSRHDWILLQGTPLASRDRIRCYCRLFNTRRSGASMMLCWWHTNLSFHPHLS